MDAWCRESWTLRALDPDGPPATWQPLAVQARIGKIRSSGVARRAPKANHPPSQAPQTLGSQSETGEILTTIIIGRVFRGNPSQTSFPLIAIGVTLEGLLFENNFVPH